jgi:hypothetical protein
MKKYLIIVLISGFVGFVLGNAFWYLASPLWIDRVVSEAQPSVAASVVLASGEVSGVDFVHKGRGTATVIRDRGRLIIRFTDFEVTNGPGLRVWLVKHDNPREARDVTGSEWLVLGELKGNVGDQNYTIPAHIDIAEYGSVVIWCEPFSVLFAGATLTPVS